MPSPGHFPPPSRPDERYQAVVDRGTRLQRRDRMTKGLVTGGIAAVVVLVVVAGVFALSGGTSDDVSPVASSTTESTTTTSTTPKDEVTVTATDEQGAIIVRVNDPQATMAPSDSVCAYVRVQRKGDAGIAAAEGTSCWNPAVVEAVTPGTLTPTNGAEVGCGINQSNTVEKPDESPTTLATAPPIPITVDHEFQFGIPDGLTSGDYVAEVVAGLDTGDTCPAINTPDEVATDSVAVEVP